MNRQANPQRLTEADLDAAQRERWQAALPRCCGGCNSQQGRRACTCTCGVAAQLEADEAQDMWGPERHSPWLLALYAAALVLSVAASAYWPLGWAP